MKAILLISLCILAVICTSVNGLTCWLCAGSLDSDCFRGEERSMVPFECPDSNWRNATVPKLFNFQYKGTKKDKGLKDEEIDTVCVSFVTNQLGPSVVERNCGYIYKDVDICEYISEGNELFQYCSSCNDDLCNNGQPTSSISVNIVY